MKYNLVTDLYGVSQFVSDIQQVSEIGFDTETTGLDFITDTLILIQAKLNNNTYLFDCRTLGKNLVTYIIQIIKDSRRLVIGHNLNFDIKFVKNYTGELLTNVYDTMISEALIVNGIGDRYTSLADLTEKYFGFKLEKDTRNTFVGFTGPLTEQQLIYSAMDVEYLSQIKEKQLATIYEQRQDRVLSLENRLIKVLASMEMEGILIDKDLWEHLVKQSQDEAKRLNDLLIEEMVSKVVSEETFQKIIDIKLDKESPVNALEVCEFIDLPVKTKKDKKMLSEIYFSESIKTYLLDKFNINSSKQVKAILNRVYGIPVENTNEKTIDKFIADFPVIKSILDYREQEKKATSFGDNFLQCIHPVTGRIHTHYKPLGAQSGRIASEDINLQNIPRADDDTPEDQSYRRPFIARKGKVLVCGDFSQEELRLMAVVMVVSKMIKAFADGIDLHTATASGLFDIPVDQVSKKQRSRGKSCNFAVGYGSSEWGLQKNFGIPLDEGKALLNKYYNELYPEINSFKQAVGERIWESGYATTLLGRKRYFERKIVFPGGYKERDKYKAKVLRELINHIIQGTGADIIKEALCRLFEENPFGDKFKILMQVYDEIVCEVDEDIAEEAKAFVSRIMTEVEAKYLKGVVPAVVDVKIGKWWVH